MEEKNEKHREELIASIMSKIDPNDVVVNLTEVGEVLEELVRTDQHFREELVESIIYRIKPSEIVVDLAETEKIINAYMTRNKYSNNSNQG